MIALVVASKVITLILQGADYVSSQQLALKNYCLVFSSFGLGLSCNPCSGMGRLFCDEFGRNPQGRYPAHHKAAFFTPIASANRRYRTLARSYVTSLAGHRAEYLWRSRNLGSDPPPINQGP
mgnify:CR=1 FL=1